MDTTPIGLDFYPYWSAAQAFIAGNDPYRLEAMFTPEFLSVGAAHGTYPFAYLPHFFLWFAPIGALDFSLAITVWYAILALAIGLLWCLVRSVAGVTSEKLPAVSWLLVLLGYPLIWRSVLLGQAVPIIVVGLVFALYQLRSHRPLVSGVIVSLVFWKPQALLVVGAALVGASLFARDFRLIRGFIFGMCLQLGLLLAVRPETLMEFWRFTFTHARELAGRDTNLVMSLLDEVGFPSPTLVIPIAAVVVTLLVTALRGLSWNTLLLVFLPLSVLTAPYAWAHESLILLPSFALVAAWLFQRIGRSGPLLLVACFAPLLLTLPQSRIEAFSLVFPLSVLLFAPLVVREATPEPVISRSS